MSEKIKSKIGEELYNKVLEAGLKAEDFDIINDGAYVPRARLNEISGKLKATEAKIGDYETQIKETKKLLGDNEEYKEKYNKLNKTYEEALKTHDTEIVNVSKRFKIEQYLNNKGATHTDLLMGKISLNDISLDGDNLIGMDTQFEGLKKNYGDMFVETKKTGGQTTPPNENNNNSGDSVDSENWGELLKDFV